MLNSLFANSLCAGMNVRTNNEYHQAKITRERENMVINAVVAFIMELYLKEAW